MKRRNGYTLVEVLISMMLTAVMVGGVFSIAITGQQSGNKVDRRVLVNQYSRHLSETLAGYVADSNSITTAKNGIIAGPTSATAGTPSWQIGGVGGVAAGAAITGEDGRDVQDDCGTGTFPSNCYALLGGTHTLHQFLPQWFENAPYKATLTYYVKPTAGLDYSNNTDPQQANMANIAINWTEP